jgi:predicted dehydrogenase
MGLLHASILNTIPNVKTTVICESNHLLMKFTEKALNNIKIVDAIHGFSNAEVDAVFVSTPIPSHAGVISELYNMGINNIFTEKTLAAEGKESLQICKLAEQAGGMNMVGYMARFAVPFKKARELLKSGIIGEVLSFQGYTYSSDFIGIQEKSFLRGGVLRDLGCHVLDLAQWYFGDFTLTDANIEPKTPVNGESSARFNVTGNNNLKGEFDISWCRKGYRIPDYGLVITGVKGSLEVNNDSVKLAIDGKQETWYRADLNDSVPFLLGAAEYYREDRAFIDAIINKKPPDPDFNTSSKIDCFIDQVKIKAGGGQ